MMDEQSPALRYAGTTNDLRPDAIDFRDVLYRPTMVEVPPELPLSDYLGYEVPVLDQGLAHGCTGFTLATVAHYLLRKRRLRPDRGLVSPSMLYAMARKYDEYPGDDDSRGSSLRGALKGWHKHGVCSHDKWPWDPKDLHTQVAREQADDAQARPLGSYQRVNHKDIQAMHSALAEVGILAASAHIPFSGWYFGTTKEGWIPRVDTTNPLIGPWGGHAFAIVGFDDEGFWLHNSWGPSWGRGGCGRIPYDDWLDYGLDAWVARLGAPVRLMVRSPKPRAPKETDARSFGALRPHFVSVDDMGQLHARGLYATAVEDVRVLVEEDIPAITEGWEKKRIVVFAGGGLTRQARAIDRLSELRPMLLSQHIYPIVVLWESDHWSAVVDILNRAHETRRLERGGERAFRFMLDRMDDALEALARRMGGKAQWDQTKLAALDSASDPHSGGVSLTMARLGALLATDPRYELHLVGHSAGALMLAPVVQLVTGVPSPIKAGPLAGQEGLGQRIASCTLLAPACKLDLFRETYEPAIRSGGIERFALFTLTDEVERTDDCDGVYGKSFLYLVSNAFERRLRVPGGKGVPLLGLEASLSDPEHAEVLDLLTPKEPIGPGRPLPRAEWIRCPNDLPVPRASTCRRHLDMERDGPTRASIVQRILSPVEPPT